ncbi:unnamed protein product [Didymodactylos carnosus]|uniref:Uncharacterized protein n=1 Tax=Didymodactylos carnosus TaxID=1234261 RepID=A0A815SJT9_9BILA|nr:unnamed protein product [Didymodactylos carnosus]CAF4355750.1 unnamed protein product [Didymodactylos carnosus]
MIIVAASCAAATAVAAVGYYLFKEDYDDEQKEETIEFREKSVIEDVMNPILLPNQESILKQKLNLNKPKTSLSEQFTVLIKRSASTIRQKQQTPSKHDMMTNECFSYTKVMDSEGVFKRFIPTGSKRDANFGTPPSSKRDFSAQSFTFIHTPNYCADDLRNPQRGMDSSMNGYYTTIGDRILHESYHPYSIINMPCAIFQQYASPALSFSTLSNVVQLQGSMKCTHLTNINLFERCLMKISVGTQDEEISPKLYSIQRTKVSIKTDENGIIFESPASSSHLTKAPIPESLNLIEMNTNAANVKMTTPNVMSQVNLALSDSETTNESISSNDSVASLATLLPNHPQWSRMISQNYCEQEQNELDESLTDNKYRHHSISDDSTVTPIGILKKKSSFIVDQAEQYLKSTRRSNILITSTFKFKLEYTLFIEHNLETVAIMRKEIMKNVNSCVENLSKILCDVCFDDVAKSKESSHVSHGSNSVSNITELINVEQRKVSNPPRGTVSLSVVSSSLPLTILKEEKLINTAADLKREIVGDLQTIVKQNFIESYMNQSNLQQTTTCKSEIKSNSQLMSNESYVNSK